MQDILTLLRAADEPIRLAAVWSLENLTYEADEGVQQQVFENMEWSLWTDLTRDSNVVIQVRSTSMRGFPSCLKS